MDLPSLLAALPERISAIVRQRAALAPHAPALHQDGRTWSYADLAGEVDAHAFLLRQLGVRAGDRVMVVGENCVAQVALIFAAAELDAWIVNVNARLSSAEVANIRQHSRARRVLYTVAASPEALKHAIGDGAEAIAGLTADLMAGSLNEQCTPEPVEPGNSQVAALIYTTGTTGHPKGVMLTHRNLLFIAAVSSTLRGLTPQDRAYGVLPISHVYGLASVMLGTLYAGACLYLSPRFSSAAMLGAIGDDKLTILQGVPAMYARLLQLAAGAPSPLPSHLRFIYAGGSPLDPVLKQQVENLFGLPLHNGYGMTESSPTISQTRLDAPRADTSVGIVIPGVEVRLVDADGVDVARGEAGELWVRGPNVMKGYYREPEQTAATMRPGGWLNTGDMARRDGTSALFIVGRTRELIIRSGFNVYPLEVETALNAYPGVIQSAVVGRLAAAGNEEVVAFVETDRDNPPSPEELHHHLARQLSAYKCPSEIVIMAALPAAATGKILKGQLKALAQTMPLKKPQETSR
ncbi:MAG: long-chain fatty acid--CoA ligase [Massilia sp.]|nr:long-chain fatty acid--CoA ligase [Massilia sp.]MDB5952058.1 long-chain fatty acid--CoA ligase [Massilia sp.]